jgi:2,3-bisphosphoglycerate-independent phosphoglycerate mutase
VPKKSVDGGRQAAKGRRKQTLWVVGPRGRQRFLRGMVTHDLVSRGFAFEDAFAVAKALRDRLSGRREVTTAELWQTLGEQVARLLGRAAVARLSAPPAAGAPGELAVVDHGQRLPFSRGLLARSFFAAGLDPDLAYKRALDIEQDLRDLGVDVFSSEEIARRAGDLLEARDPKGSAERYRLLRQIQRLPKPVVLYLCGASGTGKSTMALELAPLLRLYRINATDTIRQVMRSLFPAQILPAIHRSSFQVAPELAAAAPRAEGAGKAGAEAGELDAEPTQPLIASFTEQSEKVAVGVRAVVERAIAEKMSIVVEGVHLVPPQVPFADLEDQAFQVAILLATPDPELHHSRFQARGRATSRRSERYLQNFAAIRAIHDYLVEQAEAEDIPVLDTSFADAPQRALRAVTDALSQQLLAFARRSAPASQPPTLVVFVDGMADQPVRALQGRTPLQAARLPTLDRLAREGCCGQVDAVEPGMAPDTAAGSLALFGQLPRTLARGPIEALGAGIELEPGDVALRVNLATVDGEGRIVDRRAGRIRHESPALAEALDGLKLRDADGLVEVRVAAGTEHRLALVLRGPGLSPAIQGSDPGGAADQGGVRPLEPRALDPQNAAAARTARLLALFEAKARQVLAKHPLNEKRRQTGKAAANAVLTRGAGRLQAISRLEYNGRPLRFTCVAGDRTVLGIAALLGGEIVAEPSMTGNLDTDLAAKFRAAGRALDFDDLVIVHVKGADIAAHDRDPSAKVHFLEQVDRELGHLLETRQPPLRVVVTCDHATLSETGQHAADPLPLLLWGETCTIEDDVQRFDEESVRQGSLGRFALHRLMAILYPTWASPA